MERDVFSVTMQMRKLRERAGLSMDEMARALGYARASSIQRYENENEFSKDFLAIDLTQKVADVLIGRGNPPIQYDEVWALGLPDARMRLLTALREGGGEIGIVPIMSAQQKQIDSYGGRLQHERALHSPHGSFSENNDLAGFSNARIKGRINFDEGRRLPVYGQAVAGINGEFELNGNVVFDVLCPPQLSDVNNAYAVEVSGDSMWPRYRDGEIVYCDPTRRVKKGDFVVAQIMVDEYASAPQAFIKMFVRHNAKELVLEQFNPSKMLTFEHQKVVSVHYIAMSGDAL